MTHLAAAGAAHAARLADRVGREVVLVEVALGRLLVQPVERLAVAHRTEGRDRQDLRLTAREQPGAVNPRQQTSLGEDRADGGHVTAVAADAFVEDHAADDLALELAHVALQLTLAVSQLGILLDERGDRLGAELGQRVVVVLLARGTELGAPAGAEQLVNARLERLIGHRQGHLGLRPTDLLAQFVLDRADGLDRLVTGFERGQQVLVAHLLGARLNHRDRVERAGDHQVQLGLGELLVGRVDDRRAIDPAHADGADGAGKGNVGDMQRGRRGETAQRVGDALLVGRQGGQDDLHLVAHAVGEQRPQRAVGHARDQHGAVTGPPLTAREGHRDTAGGIGLDLEVDGQGEEIAVADVAHGGGGQHGHLAVAHDNGAVGLFGHLAGFDHEVVVADTGGYCGCVHSYSSSMRPPQAAVIGWLDGR